MTQHLPPIAGEALATALGPQAAPRAVLGRLEQILAPTEAQFTAAGDALGAAMADVRGLAAALVEIEGQAGQAAGHRLLEGSAALSGRVSAMEQGFAAFLDAIGGLRGSVRSIRRDVNELDAVLRTIANVAINARIQGHALYPPRPQVTAFIERLGIMTAEADGVIAQINAATAQAQAGLALVDTGAHDLCEQHLPHLTASLLRMAGAGQRAEAEHRALSSQSVVIGQRMAEVDTSLGRVILSLQVGDSTRQRVQKIKSILEDLVALPPEDPTTEGVLLRLAADLAAGAQADLFQGLHAATTAMAEVERATTQVLAAARALYYGPEAGALGHLTGEGGILQKKMADADAAQADLVAQSADIGASLSSLLAADRELRRIAHEVRLSGLNAVIVCARLGHEGRALRELAQWLRSLTDESETILSRLRQTLTEAQARADLNASDELTFLRDEASQLGHGCDSLCHEVMAMQGVLSATTDVLARTARSLPDHLGRAHTNLVAYHAMGQALGHVVAQLTARAALLPPADGPMAPGGEAAVRLAQIRAGYTMAQERKIHDAICAASPWGQVAPVAASDTVETDRAETDRAGAEQAGPVAPLGAVAEQDLDDIFF